MKRCFWIYCILFAVFHIGGGSVCAAVYELDEILDAQIRKYGVFNGETGLIYASVENFGDSSVLFTAYFTDGELGFSVFDNQDGAEQTDALSFPVGGKNRYVLSLGSVGGDSAVLLTTNGIQEAFVLRGDRFEQSYRKAVVKKELAEYRNGKIQIKTEEDIFALLKSLKNKRILESRHPNLVGELRPELRQNICNLLSACADVMSFDKNNPDPDRLMRSVLNTHQNFTALTDLPPDSGGNDKLGFVSAEFVDYIIRNIFGSEPVKPRIDELIQRGFCLNGNRYDYEKLYNVTFSTEILDLVAAYPLGRGVYYVVFSDIYLRGDTKIEEYSFAVVKTAKQYALLRLGMGEPLLSDSEISAYAPFGLRNNYFYSNIPMGKYEPISVKVRTAAAIVAGAIVIGVAAVWIWKCRNV